MNAKRAYTTVALLAGFAAATPMQTGAQPYGYGDREEPGYYYARDRYDNYRAERHSGSAPLYRSTEPAYDSTYSYPAIASERGMVETVEVVAERGRSSGAGAVIGGIAGGALGNQLGSGAGNAAATIGGVLGGAYLGNELERRRRSDETYRFNVRMDDGSLRSFTQDTPEIRPGNRVRVSEHGQIVLS